MSTVDLQPILDALKADAEPHLKALLSSFVHKGLLPALQAYAQSTGNAIVITVEGVADPMIAQTADAAIAAFKL